jgi:hypothetical protein
MFVTVNTGLFILIIATFVTDYCVFQNALAGSQGAWFPELFNANTRSSGASLAYQISAIASGFTPFITTLLYEAYGCGAQPCCSAVTWPLAWWRRSSPARPGDPGNASSPTNAAANTATPHEWGS